jgi:glycosyltransferase involved in cell wall biosynthesis
MRKTSWHVGVLIPARNEEELLPRCLRSVIAACSALPHAVTFDVIVAVDSSTDRTLELAERMVEGYGVVVRTETGIAGRARRLAAELALIRNPGSRRRCWLANTDADCMVPIGWLNDHLALAAMNVQAIAGTVNVDTFEEHGPMVEARFRATYLVRPDGSHLHVHGANLGFRADTYVKAGGWRDLMTGEDHDLWNRLARVGARRVSTSRTEVLTSGRRVGRAPHGFAEALASHNETAA